MTRREARVLRWSMLAGVIALSLAASGCASLFCIACDGFLGAEGGVYERSEAIAGSHSVVRIDSDQVRPEGLLPIEGAQVVLEPWTPEKRPTGESVERLSHRAVSNASGAFRVGGTVRPGWFKATLSVRREGYRPVEQVFMHDRFHHQVFVILVREGAANEGVQ